MNTARRRRSIIVNAMPINSDKPHLWKADVSASVDLYNDWFLTAAPVAFRESRAISTGKVRLAFKQTEDLNSITLDTLERNPAVLSTLRMSTAPPIARDRLIGLAGVNRTVVRRMEEGQFQRVFPAKSEPGTLARSAKLLRA
jgi:hypothetical protein